MLTIRPEIPADIPAIDALNCACFPLHLEAILVDRLRESGRLTVSLVAEWRESLAGPGRVVGQIAWSPVTTPQLAIPPQALGVGLAPVAVDADLRRQGIATRLVQAGLDRCRELGFGWCVVLGEPAFYRRFGFRPAYPFGLFDRYEGGDAFQVLELSPGALPRDAGRVEYAPEFAIFDES
ncbi:GNAT family N-acetyltransferase [Tuwongella immobilis]|uniref:N-acetyltransferase domain-containing protein n=1 Tax=Tuwongella immobilis TaxID=692036 RepID=A0A6C2YJS7_9BACT|nr:N-acetyltransferase [Tuwongella immobilis]VIP01479.1 acyl- n-acyltransferase : Uncharacterized protein OS=uncultured organism GN=META_00021 PE=4 SV=1: Acetyltransf_1 [Tuwongella immobilis]VTR98529.1 acyl- n-acyltransferase : Uncharacterized protein OS=uncultured organism GN=META_00021 PE=4 SV=1: Acetyltransf_1 [Tuwongella immobilis]